VAAVSVGLVDGETLLDLCYEEDFRAQVDFNVVMTDKGEMVEVQGTGEHGTFSKALLDELLSRAQGGIKELLQRQAATIQTMGDGG
jgi:ribonuclease PH